ncbi:MAG TPA: hypothetical protein VF786_08265 [Terriglobales bacterium]
MSDILERIQRVAGDLRAIEKELSELSKSDLSSEDRLQELDYLLRHDVTQQLKFAVDSMRELLWQYFEQLSKTNGVPAEEALHSFRLRRITDMLQTLRQSSDSIRSTAVSPGTPETTSFLSEIQHFACQITDVRRAEALTQERAILANPDKFPKA